MEKYEFTKNFEVKFNDSDLPIYHTKPIEIKTSISTTKDKISINSFKIISELINASIFGTIASACVDVNKYRMWKYGDSFCWLFFNARFGIGALGGVIGEVLNQISLTVGIIRYRKKETNNSSCSE